jgi:uncharacterized Zn finger protein
VNPSAHKRSSAMVNAHKKNYGGYFMEEIKTEAIKEAIEERKRIHAEKFKGEIERLVFEIERKSKELRNLKKQLMDMHFTEVELNVEMLF